MTIPKAIGIAVVALVWSLVAEAVVDGWSQPLFIPLADLAVGWALVASGLVGMIRRPGQVAGGRLVIAGFLWWVGNFAGSADPRIAIIGFAFQGYHDVVLALLVLSFPPAGRPVGSTRRSSSGWPSSSPSTRWSGWRCGCPGSSSGST